LVQADDEHRTALAAGRRALTISSEEQKLAHGARQLALK